MMAYSNTAAPASRHKCDKKDKSSTKLDAEELKQYMKRQKELRKIREQQEFKEREKLLEVKKQKLQELHKRCKKIVLASEKKHEPREKSVGRLKKEEVSKVPATTTKSRISVQKKPDGVGSAPTAIKTSRSMPTAKPTPTVSASNVEREAAAFIFKEFENIVRRECKNMLRSKSCQLRPKTSGFDSSRKSTNSLEDKSTGGSFLRESRNNNYEVSSSQVKHSPRSRKSMSDAVVSTKLKDVTNGFYSEIPRPPRNRASVASIIQSTAEFDAKIVHEEKLNEAAAKIQAAYKGYKIRKILTTAKLELERAVLKQKRLHMSAQQTSPTSTPVRRKSRPEKEYSPSSKTRVNGSSSQEGSPKSKIPRSSESGSMLASTAHFRAATERLPGYIPPPLEPLYRSSPMSPRVLPFLRPKQIDEPFPNPKRLETLRSELSQNTSSPLKLISSISKFQMPSYLKSKEPPRQSRLLDEIIMNRRKSLTEIDAGSSQAQEYKEKLQQLRTEVDTKYMSPPRSKHQATSRSRRTLSEHMYNIPDPGFAQVLQEKLRLMRLENAAQKQAAVNDVPSPQLKASAGISQTTVAKATEQIKQKIVEAKQILEDYKKELLLSSNQLLSHQQEEPTYESDFDGSVQTSLSQSLPTGAGHYHRTAEIIHTKELKITNISPRKPQVAVRPNTSQSSLDHSISRHERVRTAPTTSISRSPKRRPSAHSREVIPGAVRSETKIPTPPRQQPGDHQSSPQPTRSQEMFVTGVQKISLVPANDLSDDQASISSRELVDETETDYEDVVESKAESRQPAIEENYDTDFDSELQSLTASKQQSQRQELLTSVADTDDHSPKQEALTSIADTEEHSYEDDRSDFDVVKTNAYPQAEVETPSMKPSMGIQIVEELPPSVEPSADIDAPTKESVAEELASYDTDFDTDVPSSVPVKNASSVIEPEDDKMSSIAVDFEESVRDSTINEEVPEEPSVNQTIIDEVSEASKPSYKSKIPVVIPAHSFGQPTATTTAPRVQPTATKPSEIDRPKVVSEAAKASARRLMDELSESSDSDISTPKDIDDIMEKILAEDFSDEPEDEVLESAETEGKFEIEKPRDAIPEVSDISPQVDGRQKLDDNFSPLPLSLIPAATVSEATENWSSVALMEREYPQAENSVCVEADVTAEVAEIETSQVESAEVIETAQVEESQKEESVQEKEISQEVTPVPGTLTIESSLPPSKLFIELESETKPEKPDSPVVESPPSTAQTDDSSASEIIMLAKRIDASIVEKIESLIVEEVSKKMTVEEHDLEADSQATKVDDTKSSAGSKDEKVEDVYESDFDTEVSSEKSEKTGLTDSASPDRSKGRSRLEIVVQEEVENLIETKEIAVEFIVTGKIPAQPIVETPDVEARLQRLVRRKELMDSLVVRILQRILKDVVLNHNAAEKDIERIQRELTAFLEPTNIESISPIPKPSIEDDLDDSVHGDLEGEEWFEDDLMGTSHTDADEESLKVEAAKILAEQLRIEKEIQALEALQAQGSPQVPPPPPYSPPAQESVSSSPASFTVQCTAEQLLSKISLVVNSMWRHWTSTGSFAIAEDVFQVVDEMKNTVCNLEVHEKEKKPVHTPSATCTRAFNNLLHDLIVDTIKEVLKVEDTQNDATKSYVDRIRPGSLALEAAKLRIPRTEEALTKLTFCRISNLLPYPTLQGHVPAVRKRLAKWTSRPRDLVDEVLAEELIDEDREWTESWPEEILVLDRWTEKFCRRALDQVLSDYETVFSAPAHA